MTERAVPYPRNISDTEMSKNRCYSLWVKSIMKVQHLNNHTDIFYIILKENTFIKYLSYLK